MITALTHQFIQACLLQKKMHEIRFYFFSIYRFPIQLMQQGFSRLNRLGNTADLKFIAAAANAHTQSAFEMFDVLVYRPD